MLVNHEPHMIARSADWKNALANAVRDPAELLSLLGLPETLLEGAVAAARDFPLRVPRGFVARMQPGDPSDPLLRQVLPLGEEMLPVAGFGPDPVGDLAAQAGAGLLHKYHGRVLMTATGACAVHCRYCFRRHFPYGEQRPGRDNWQGVVDYLQAHPEVDELILSGGDPLMLDDQQLHALSQRLREIPQLKRLRLHSRMPIVLPERIDGGLLDWLGSLPWPVVMVVHCNHPQELDDQVSTALIRLRQAGLTLLNQSVLLAGINDDADTLIRLSRRLFDCQVLPYYLHLLDRVAGAAHFDTDHTRLTALMESLRVKLPGYLLPRLVRELPGDLGKQLYQGRGNLP
jgi:EF-P beta-lysylation protein EpmB